MSVSVLLYVIFERVVAMLRCYALHDLHNSKCDILYTTQYIMSNSVAISGYSIQVCSISALTSIVTSLATWIFSLHCSSPFLCMSLRIPNCLRFALAQFKDSGPHIFSSHSKQLFNCRIPSRSTLLGSPSSLAFKQVNSHLDVVHLVFTFQQTLPVPPPPQTNPNLPKLGRH
jgi:hypothetical protein